MEGPHIDTHTFIQGKDKPSSGWAFDNFEFDVYDSWTQLICLAGLVGLYGAAIVYYVHTKKFEKPKARRLPRNSKAWKAWDRAQVNFNWPYITQLKDFLGWNKEHHHKDFDGHIYLYCMPRAGPCQDYKYYIEKKLMKSLKFDRLPFRAFFFEPKRHLDADQLIDCPKKFPFKELTDCIMDIGLQESVPSLSISMPETGTGDRTLRIATTFPIDANFKGIADQYFERVKDNLRDSNPSGGVADSFILETIVSLPEININKDKGL